MKRVFGAVKRGILQVAIVASACTMMGCSFSIGDIEYTNNESYKDIFTDANDKAFYSSKMMSYTYSVDGYGEMQVYVDTSDKHSFELIDEPAGFKVLDAEGDVVLRGVCMGEEEYAEYTAFFEDTTTVNGRKFFYRENEGDDTIDICSYMADCGLDCGIVLEVYDEDDKDCFSLLAFRGEPLKDASSSIYHYQGDPENYELPVSDEETDEE